MSTSPTLAASTTLPPASAPPPARWPRRWAWVPAGLLVSLIGTQLGVLAAVLEDPSFATEPDYYRKAVDWDSHMVRARQSQALGWSTRARVEAASAGGGRALVLAITDRAGAPVSGARVRALAFHNAHAAQPLVLAPTEAAPGEYRAAFAPRQPGLWELRVVAERGAERFEATQRFELMAGAR
jgi:nitrogen fixation protein FixH